MERVSGLISDPIVDDAERFGCVDLVMHGSPCPGCDPPVTYGADRATCSVRFGFHERGTVMFVVIEHYANGDTWTHGFATRQQAEWAIEDLQEAHPARRYEFVNEVS